jgi:hypothetical protein
LTAKATSAFTKETLRPARRIGLDAGRAADIGDWKPRTLAFTVVGNVSARSPVSALR